MKLLGHTSPDMTMRYLDVAATDLQREFQLARSRPRHLVPQPKVPLARMRGGVDGLVDSLRAAQHVLEMFRRHCHKALLANASTASLTGLRRFFAKPVSSPHPENGQRLAG